MYFYILQVQSAKVNGTKPKSLLSIFIPLTHSKKPSKDNSLLGFNVFIILLYCNDFATVDFCKDYATIARRKRQISEGKNEIKHKNSIT